MAANTIPIFTDTPNGGMGQVTGANTARDGSGSNLVTFLTAGADGTRVSKIRVVAAGTTTAGVVRIFVKDGTNTRLFLEILVTAITPSTTIEVFSAERYFDEPLVLPTGWTMIAGTHNAETFNIFATAGDY